MNPKEKAAELYNKFYNFSHPNSVIVRKENAKQCALIAVEEVLKFCPMLDGYNPWSEEDIKYTDYWQQVKEEIEKL